ncbi:hypothetical protein ACH5AL_34380 [Actinacidiphila glaucinigra]|uniref:hypothetical protein n=1 Tax=Actinacidiphila glaucinigra TaxID=235986 RepID=UPI00379997A0
MRNEYASVPWLSVIAPLMPRVIAADWSHEVIGRDWMIQTLLDGSPASGPHGLIAYPRPAWRSFFRQMGAIAKKVHAVRGPHFGPVAGPVCDVESGGAGVLGGHRCGPGACWLNAADMQQVVAAAKEESG